MAGLGALLNKGSSGAAPNNADANTGTSDANANQTSENANGDRNGGNTIGEGTETVAPTGQPQPATTEGDALNRAATSVAKDNPTAVQNATTESFQDENNLGGDNRGLAPDHNLLGREESGDREPLLIATSAPIQRFKIGRFQFERAVLNLYESKDVDDFRKLVSGLPPVDRNQIKIIDKEAAENLVRPIEPGATKQFDSSVGRQRETLATGDKVIGSDPLDDSVGGQGEKFAKVAQMDNNAPVAGTDANNVANQVNQGDVQSDEQIDAQKAANNGDGESVD